MREVHLAFENNLTNQYDGVEFSVFGNESYSEGKHGRALYLNGSSFVQIPINSRLSLLDNDFTIAGWFYATAWSQTTSFFECTHLEYFDFYGNYIGEGLQVYRNARKGLSAYIPGVNTSKTFSSEDITVELGTWYHIALTRKDSTFRLFLNGTVVAEMTFAEEIAQYAGDVYRVGSSICGNTENEITTQYSMIGLVDDFFIDPQVCWWTENFTLRDTYSELLYIQSPSATDSCPCIDSGVIARWGIRVKMDVKVLAQEDVITFFGAASSSSGGAPPGYTLKWSASSSGSTKGIFTAYYGTTSITFGSEIDILDRLCIDYCYPSITINGVSAEFPLLSAPSSDTAQYNLYIFGENSSNYSGRDYTGPSAKLYAVDIFIDDTQIRDYVPAYYPNGAYSYFLQDTIIGLNVCAKDDVFYYWDGPSVSGGHTTLVNGDVYSLGRGNVLLNGTSYEIISGKSLIDGVSYDLVWPCSLVLSGNGGSNLLDNTHAYINVGGTTYTSTIDTTVEVLPGTIVKCYCRGTYGGYITVNGTDVASGTGNLTYEYIVTTDATIKVSYSAASYYSRITITEE